ncbi:NADP-dependent oxidoreductase [Actinomadura rayongensis]|uniref:Zinc-binding dehydrogenase n=1 Tax=Actinomadura rayongensis TaxID=1429076 RepID=A0A6I4WCM7_9ACTN|nr:NADP-dependent oxidoreductase [Actinomadura rayongensis]MXQ65985.1 zinc-binding dehydrogenase [Actinomadura rayongensis]
MRAITVAEYGATPSLMNLPEPEPGPGEVQIELVAAGLNPLDWKIADGMRKDVPDVRFPLVLGTDGAGVVTAAGSDDTRLKVGDRVFGAFHGAVRGQGTYAEFTVAGPDDAVAVMPEEMPYVLAAALPTAGVAAVELVDDVGIAEGQTILVIGASGGVGQNAVQLAAARGADVVATARPDAADRMRDLGAATVVDHQDDLNAQVLAQHGEVDTIIDLVNGPSATEHVAGLLKPGGTYLSTVHAVNPDAMDARGLRGVNFETRGGTAAVEHVAALVEAGDLRVAIHAEPPLEEAPAALAESRKGHADGKTVIRI